MAQIDILKFLVEKGPNRTEAELAKAIHGAGGYQQQVNQDLALLVSRGQLYRRGLGGPTDPFRYFRAG